LGDSGIEGSPGFISILSLPGAANEVCVVVGRLLLGFMIGGGGDANSGGRKPGGAGRLKAGMFDVLETRVGSEIMFFVTDFLRPAKLEAERWPNEGRNPLSCEVGYDGSVGVETFESAGELSGGVELAE
jgi:hypothetical protein